MGSMYNRIRKEQAETAKALKKACPKCHQLMKEVNGGWCCVKCGEKVKK